MVIHASVIPELLWQTVAYCRQQLNLLDPVLDNAEAIVCTQACH